MTTALDTDLAHCLSCGRPLSDPASKARQVGPICARKFAGDKHVTPVPRLRRRRLDVDRVITGFPDLAVP